MTINKKKVVFITGGSRGIGKALVEKFKSEDWNVATCATQKTSFSNADLNLVCDVSNVSNVRDAINSIITHFGRLDALINNAAIAGKNSLHPEDNDDFWHRIINVNLHGAYYASKYALPHLPDVNGRILNISSVLGLIGVPDQTAYCAAKHGLLGFTKALALNIASRRITVNAICPGWVRTDMAYNRMQEIGLSEKDLATSVPLGRFIEPHEVADLAFYLITSDAAALITGQSFTIDGGRILA